MLLTGKSLASSASNRPSSPVEATLQGEYGCGD